MSTAERDNRVIFEQAKEMRTNASKAENRLKEILNQVTPKFPYVFQYVELPHILDFYFPTLGICMEVGGESNFERRKNDITRDAFLLEKKGIVTYRFSSSEVLYNSQMAEIISQILRSLNDTSPPPGNYCPDCGSQREADSIFCRKCGGRLS